MEMDVVQESTCNRCDREVAHNKPACPNCGLWQPWGDRAVAAARRLRLGKFREQECKAELALLRLRVAPESRIGREGLRYRVLRWLHLQKIGSGRQVAAASLATFALTLAACWFVFAPTTSTRQMSTRAQRSTARASGATEIAAAPSAKCRDGSLSYAQSHSGACGGHGGVEVFFGER